MTSADIESVESETVLATVWLLATMGGAGAGVGVSGKRGKAQHCYTGRNTRTKAITTTTVEKIDIVKTCNCIIDVSNRVSLRRSSNLMFGTVLAYKSKCFTNWKDVNSCRMMIQRMNDVMVSGKEGNNEIMKKKNVGYGNKREKRIALLDDDPGFDISQGLMVLEYDGLKGGNDRDDENGWKENIGFDEEKEEDEKEYAKEGEQIDKEVSEASRIEVGTQNEIYEDLNFGFDVNGELVEDKENEKSDKIDKIAKMEEEEIHRSLMEGMEDNIFNNGFDIIPDFEPMGGVEEAKERVEQEKEEEEEEEVVPTRKRKINTKEKKRNNKRLIIDTEVCLSVANIKSIRDGYVLHENEERRKYFDGMQYEIRNVVMQEFVDIDKEYRSGFSKLRGLRDIRGKEEEDIPYFGNGNDFDNIDMGLAMDIEVGREKQHSRSSSISSIEEVRRASERNSSSFHFDFNDGRSGKRIENEDKGEDMNDDMNVAQLDITFGDGSNREGSEGVVCTTDGLEGFYRELEGSNIGDVEFSSMVKGCGKREVSLRFLYVLQLATWNRVGVEQRGLCREIRVVVK